MVSEIVAKNLTLGGENTSLYGDKNDRYFKSVGSSSNANLEKVISKFKDTKCSVLDIGANIGVTSIILARKFFKGKIYSFEASNFACNLLKKNITHNRLRNVTINQSIVCDDSGSRFFFESGAHGRIIHQTDVDSFKNVKMLESTSIDDFVYGNHISNIQFVKIDVEGFDILVVEGMKKMIERDDPVVYLEFNSWCICARLKINPLDVLLDLQNRFRYLYFISSDGRPKRIVQSNLINYLHVNMVDRGCVDNLVVGNDYTKIELVLSGFSGF